MALLLNNCFTFLSCMPIFLIVIYYFVYCASASLQHRLHRLSKKGTLWLSVKLLLAVASRGCLRLVQKLIEWYGQLVYGWSLVGWSNVVRHLKAKNGQAMFIFYHGVLPIDMAMVANQLNRIAQPSVSIVADQVLFSFGLFNFIGDYCFSGPAEKCVAELAKGKSLLIAPGGAREAFFATTNYDIVWNNRTGFARVAQEAKVDIIPVFTQNIRHIYYVPPIFQRIFRRLYERYRVILVPVFSRFPIKLTTHFGAAIAHNSVDTPEELAKLTERAIAEMIKTHQHQQ